MIRWLINYIRSFFCKHDWELIFHGQVQDGDGHYWNKIYRCKKCGYSKKYKSI